ncbi:MAG TPA: DoxX family membrane protein [Pyrinomonadaceae bacterium]|nr:DoxX family membrane protein [Pyrinomonadaceae bacterium]
MAPLIFLIVTFGITALADRYFLKGRLGLSLAGRIAMAVMLLVTGITHFTNTDEMIKMMPDPMPWKREMVYFTGVCEFLAIPGLIWERTRRLAAILLIVFFVAVLPANVVGSMKQVQMGGMEYGTVYLWFRVPLQIFFIWWTWYFALRLPKGDRPSRQ